MKKSPYRSLSGLLRITGALGALLLWAAPALAADSAVFLMYHRFGESDYPSTNIRLEQFEEHIKELSTGGYSVLPAEQAVEALRNGRQLPDRTVVITIDDGYRSIYTEAWPRLKAAGLPFTVFIATAPIDQERPGYMTWDQIREMRDAGVTIGAHTVTHLHMPRADNDRLEREIVESNKRFAAELGTAPRLFAYPYGEISVAARELVLGVGKYVGAFGQQSGATHVTSDPFNMPRYALNEDYGNMSRFKLVANSLPIPVEDLTPMDFVVGETNPPLVGFTVAPGIDPLDRLACFASTEGKIPLLRLGERRVEVRLSEPLPVGRSRINCTMPGGEGRWRWLGLQFTRPRT